MLGSCPAASAQAAATVSNSLLTAVTGALSTRILCIEAYVYERLPLLCSAWHSLQKLQRSCRHHPLQNLLMTDHVCFLLAALVAS